jgi:hypothetical protein
MLARFASGEPCPIPVCRLSLLCLPVQSKQSDTLMFQYNFKVYLLSLFCTLILFLIIFYKTLWIITPNYRMTPNYELGITSKEAVVVYFKVLPLHSFRISKGNHKKL